MRDRPDHRRRAAGRGLVLGWLAAAALACDATESEEWTTRERRGDTLFVSTSPAADPAVMRRDSFEVLWKSDSLENPLSMARAGGRLFIADRVRLHVVSETGDHIATVGRNGEGPGEFRNAMAIGVHHDTVIVLDSRLQRFSLHDRDGTFLDSRRTPPATPFVSPMRDGALDPFEGGMLYLAIENVHTDRPTRSAMVWRGLSGDTTRILREWDAVLWKDMGALLAPASLFPPRAIVAVGREGRYAHGDGLEYCFSVEKVDAPPVTRICRAWQRVAVGPHTRNPPISDIEMEPNFRQAIEQVFREQEVEDEWPSFDRLLLGPDGAIWVRTIGPEQPDANPQLYSQAPHLRPTHRVWEVFEASGALQSSITLPTTFDVRVVAEHEAFGFGELETGEKVIARVGF